MSTKNKQKLILKDFSQNKLFKKIRAALNEKSAKTKSNDFPRLKQPQNTINNQIKRNTNGNCDK